MNQYPPINTLLSTPFSLFSNLPRLISISSNTYVPKGPRQNGTKSMLLDPLDNKPAHIRDRTDRFEAMRPPDPLSCNMKDLHDARQDMLDFQRSSPAQDLAHTMSLKPPEMEMKQYQNPRAICLVYSVWRSHVQV